MGKEILLWALEMEGWVPYSFLWPNNMTFPPTLSSILVEGLLAAASHWFLS